MYQVEENFLESFVNLQDAFSTLEHKVQVANSDDDFYRAGIRYVNGKWQVYIFYPGYMDDGVDEIHG